MIDIGLRCGQLMAERSDIHRMNIIERTRLWYRLERIGKLEPEQEVAVTPLRSLRFYKPKYMPTKGTSLWYEIFELQEGLKLLENKITEMQAVKRKHYSKYT